MKMQVVSQALNAGLLRVLLPMLGAFAVITLALGVVRLTVRGRFVRGLAAYAAAFVWIGWMAAYFKTV
jgi:hypothetical protein